LGGFASLPPHADVSPALRRLRAAGYRTVAFTNSSLALVERQLEASGLASDFDDVVSVEKTGSFKPEAKVYRYVADRVARAPNELRLVAAHDWDTHGALAAGLLAAYINRSGAPYHPLYQRPDVFADEMTSLVEQVIARDASPDGAG
jgi:2-haloacid dehalogenase